MAWSTDRSKRLPQDWAKRRARVLRRDSNICYLCLNDGATQVDHIVRGDNHDYSNLAAICELCHLRKSGQESGAARRARAQARHRPQERHPGLIRD